MRHCVSDPRTKCSQRSASRHRTRVNSAISEVVAADVVAAAAAVKDRRLLEELPQRRLRRSPLLRNRKPNRLRPLKDPNAAQRRIFLRPHVVKAAVKLMRRAVNADEADSAVAVAALAAGAVAAPAATTRVATIASRNGCKT